MAGHSMRIPQRGLTTVATHLVRLVVLAAADAVARLALHFEPHSALFDSAGELFVDAAALYWAYCAGADLFTRIFSADPDDVDESSRRAAGVNVFSTVTVTICATFVLAVTAFFGAKLRDANMGGPSLPVAVLLLGVFDARVVDEAVMALFNRGSAVDDT
jgi:hypothetical protein